MSKNNSTNRSIHRALDILESFLAFGGNLQLKELAEHTELNSSTAYRIANVLLERGYLKKNNSKKYSLGKKISELGNISSVNIDPNLKRIARPLMNKLRDKQQEDVRLFIREGKDKVCIEAAQSLEFEEHILNVGDKHSLINGAPGKIFMAFMSDSKRRWFLEDSNITEQDLISVREKGYAISIGEKKKGLVGIAAPIYDGYDNVIAVISLSGPSSRFINEKISDKIQDILSTAQKISDAYIHNNLNGISESAGSI